jgi:cytoskeletal protein RodZ
MLDSIGTKLREVREARNQTLEQVSQALRIRPYHLQALESDDYSAIPSAAQARGFLRNYAEYLGLNVDELLPAVRPPIAEPPPPSSTTPTMAPRPESPAAAGDAASRSATLGGFLSGLRSRLARQPETPAAGAADARPAPEEVSPSQAGTAQEGVGTPGPERQTPPSVERPLPAARSEEGDAPMTPTTSSAADETPAVKGRSQRKPAEKPANSLKSDGPGGRSTVKKKIS